MKRRSPRDELKAGGRRRFLIWNGIALIGALASRSWWARALPAFRLPLKGREARWYRRL